jgi:hypothetical protein
VVFVWYDCVRSEEVGGISLDCEGQRSTYTLQQ